MNNTDLNKKPITPPTNNKKCICVPSGRCHSHTLTGCPHKHYFNDKNVWTCDLSK